MLADIGYDALKIEIHPFTYEFCPVHMYLFENGHAVIKTSIPLEDIDAGSLATYPMQTWFWDVKVWEAVIKQGGRQEYKIVQEPGNEENISFISHLLQQCVYRLFENNLLDAKRFCSFETLVIAETERKQIWEIPGKGSVAEKEDLYHLQIDGKICICVQYGSMVCILGECTSTFL